MMKKQTNLKLIPASFLGRLRQFILLTFTFLTLFQASALAGSTIRIRNNSEDPLEIKVFFETIDGDRRSFSDLKEVDPGDTVTFRTSRNVNVGNSRAAVAIRGRVIGLGLVGDELDREWGNLSRGRYPNAAIRRSGDDYEINISIR